MTVQEILVELDAHGFEDLPHSRKLAALNATYFDVCSREAWPFLEKQIDLTFDGVERYPTNTPSDFQAVVVMSDNSNGQELVNVRVDTFHEVFGGPIGAETGSPRFFFVQGNDVETLRLHPIPLAGTLVTLIYICKPVALEPINIADDILLPEGQHMVLCDGSLARLFLFERDIGMADRFERMYERGIEGMRRTLWERQYSNTDEIVQVFEPGDEFPDLW